MIIKSYELKKLDINKNKYILFYGVNEGAKTEEIKKIISLNKNITITNYDEKEILESSENFYNNIFSKSLFEDKKVIIIKRATDKIVNIIEETGGIITDWKGKALNFQSNGDVVACISKKAYKQFLKV